MTSQINPNNINGAYPVAGQDNNSQGFRDNFTNTKTNFQYAAGEITDLQSKVLVKAPLTGGANIATQNNMGYASIINAQLKSPSYTSASLGSLSTTVPFDYSVGTYQTATIGANVTVALTGWPASGQYATLYTQITTTTTNVVITLPSSVTLGKTGIQGLSGQNLTIAQAGTYTFEFTTSDNGTTVTIQDLSRPLAYYTNNVTMVGNLSVAGTISGNIAGNLVVGGSNTQVLFNDSGNAGASSNFTFNKSTNILTLTGTLNATGNAVITGNISAGNISGNIQTGSLISTTGNVIGGNILSGSLLSAAGTIKTGTDIVALGAMSIGTTLSATGAISTAGNFTSNGVAFLTSTEDLAATSAANLAVTTSYFTTGAAETATLAAGTNGQIKIFSAVDTTAGDMVITVTNAGWKATGTGTITLSGYGTACTLQYIGGSVNKWFCVGNNGAVFA